MKVSRRKLAATVVELLRTTSDRQKVVKGLAAYLVEHNMVNQAELVAKDIAKLLAETEGHVLADVTTAFGLDDATRKSVESYIAKHASATTIELRETVDPSILGGITIVTPTQEYDASVRHKLKQLQV